mmetsp:Transcript_109508/g.349345  ORF Transcript_109508/g.349345 Transcript_109508/m.349345 type:complete len:300 (+) Transcript_109508:334-1233(+)
MLPHELRWSSMIVLNASCRTIRRDADRAKSSHSRQAGICIVDRRNVHKRKARRGSLFRWRSARRQTAKRWPAGRWWLERRCLHRTVPRNSLRRCHSTFTIHGWRSFPRDAWRCRSHTRRWLLHPWSLAVEWRGCFEAANGWRRLDCRRGRRSHGRGSRYLHFAAMLHPCSTGLHWWRSFVRGLGQRQPRWCERWRRQHLHGVRGCGEAVLHRLLQQQELLLLLLRQRLQGQLVLRLQWQALCRLALGEALGGGSGLRPFFCNTFEFVGMFQGSEQLALLLSCLVTSFFLLQGTPRLIGG